MTTQRGESEWTGWVFPRKRESVTGTAQQAVDGAGDRMAQQQAEGQPVAAGHVRPLDEIHHLRILRRQRFRVDEGVMLHGLICHLDERVDGGFAVAAGFDLGRRQLQLVVALFEPRGVFLKQARQRVRERVLTDAG